MKLSLSWLKDHLETEAGLDEIVEVTRRKGQERCGGRSTHDVDRTSAEGLGDTTA